MTTPSANLPRTRAARYRERLARLREEAEPIVAEERATALRALLQHPLLAPEGSGAAHFSLVRRHRTWLTDWFAHHTDWSLVVTAEAARLRKSPARAHDATRGAVEPKSQEPFNRTRYVLLCLALAALERSDRQVTLGRLAEHLGMMLSADPAFAAAGFIWSLDQQSGRRDFVHTLRLLVALGVLRRVQGDEDQLLQNRTSDALYNISRPGLSLLLAARRSPSLIPASSFEERLQALVSSPLPDTPEARNRHLRTRFAQQLLDDPLLLYEDLDEEARAYLDSQRPSLLQALTEATGLHAEVRREGIALVDLEGDCTDSGLPEEGTEGHLTLLLATWLADRLRKGDDSLLTLEGLRQQTARLIRQHKDHWRREVSERGAEIWLTDMVVTRLEGLGLLRRDGDGFRPLPVLGRFALRAHADHAVREEATAELPLSDS